MFLYALSHVDIVLRKLSTYALSWPWTCGVRFKFAVMLLSELDESQDVFELSDSNADILYVLCPRTRRFTANTCA
jgi:hypothetical protein